VDKFRKPADISDEGTLTWATRAARYRALPKGKLLRRQFMQRVFVLDAEKRPLIPCRPARARKLLTRHRAAVFRSAPFTIILHEARPRQSRSGGRTSCRCRSWRWAGTIGRWSTHDPPRLSPWASQGQQCGGRLPLRGSRAGGRPEAAHHGRHPCGHHQCAGDGIVQRHDEAPPSRWDLRAVLQGAAAAGWLPVCSGGAVRCLPWLKPGASAHRFGDYSAGVGM
jgi:hypothetical protein